jgi:hypothetical protein
MTHAEPKQAVWRGIVRWLPGVVISIAAFVVLFRFVSWEDITATFKVVQWQVVLLAAGLTVISLGTRAQAWRILLGERHLTLGRAYLGISEGYLLNNILPFRAGEVGRAVFIGRATGMGPFFVLSTIVIERSFDIAMAAILLLLTLPLALGFGWAKPIAIGALAAVIAGLVALFWAARKRLQVMTWLDSKLGRWSFFRNRLSHWVDSVLQGFSALTSLRQLLLSLFWIGLSWLIWVLMYWVVLRMVVPEAPIWWAAFADSVLAMGIAVPSAPGSLGVFEAAMVGALSLLGVDSSISLAYAILMHLIQYVVTGIFGVIGLIKEGQSFSSLLSSVTRQPQEPPSSV